MGIKIKMGDSMADGVVRRRIFTILQSKLDLIYTNDFSIFEII